jgi:hypothetical protein
MECHFAVSSGISAGASEATGPNAAGDATWLATGVKRTACQ